MARLNVDDALLNEIQTKYPETAGLTYTGVADWALRKLIVQAKVKP
jgi:hypothetical protein